MTNDQSPITNCIFLPLLDARRMEVYTALYDSDLHPLSEVKAVVVENEESFSEAVFQRSDIIAKWSILAMALPNAKPSSLSPTGISCPISYRNRGI